MPDAVGHSDPHRHSDTDPDAHSDPNRRAYAHRHTDAVAHTNRVCDALTVSSPCAGMPVRATDPTARRVPQHTSSE